MNETLNQHGFRRDEVEALFVEVDSVAGIDFAISVVAGKARDVRLLSHEEVAESSDRIRRLTKEFGSKGQELIDAFAQKYPGPAYRAETANIINHPAVAVAMARVMQKSADKI